MNKIFTLILVLVSSIASAQIPEDYYSNAEGKTGDALKSALHDIIDGHTQLSYDNVWDALKYTDEDTTNSNNVILLYSGWSYPKSNKGGDVTQWNREHTWAKSMGNFGTSKGPGTDIHHLRPTDVTVNSARGSYMFDEGGTEYTDASRYGGGDGATGCYKTSSSWEPADRVKGDVARMLFYMATRYETTDGYDLELREYNSGSGIHGKLSTLKAWHAADPVDAWEIRRNNRAYEKQGNRNPFIDHPEYVDSIYNYTDGLIGNETSDPGPVDDGVLNLTFENSYDGCMVIQRGGSVTWSPDSYDDAYYLKINTYGAGANESWVVTPSVNLDSLVNPSFSFQVASYFSDQSIGDCGEGQFEVYYATSFDGSSIDEDNWTRFTTVDNTELGERWDFVTVDVDIERVAGESVYFAFAHTSDTSNGTTWELDNVTVSGNTPVDNSKPELLDLMIIPNPALYSFSVNQKADQLSVVNLSGKTVLSQSNVEPNRSINISTLPSGVYIVKATYKNQIGITKLIKE